MGFRFSSSLPSCTGVEIRMLQDSSMEFRILDLSLDKRLIHINSKKTRKCTLESFVSEIKGPTAITLTGRGVLIKRTTRINGLTDGISQGLFPGLVLSEFYVQNFVSGDYSYVALIRKETLNTVLQAFAKRRNQLLIISIGPFVIDHIIPQLNVYNEELAFDEHFIRLNEDKTWSNYTANANTPTSFELKVDIETIEEQYVLAYATAFQLILNNSLESIQIGVEDVELNKIDFLAKLVFEKRVTITALVFFALLLFNFFLFTYYTSENSSKTGIASQQSQFILNQKQVESGIGLKERLVENLRWNNGLSYAFICDQVGLITPSSITLTELIVNIASGKDVVESELGIRQIRVSGRAKDVYAVNQFIYACKNRKWIKQVKLQKFTADEQNSTQVFSIIIDY